MSRQFKRQELYDLMWSEPARTVAAQIGISDVALAKACRKANIPIPARGYWAKRSAGKQTARQPLPLRFPGASDMVEVGRRSWHHDPDWEEKLLASPAPVLPGFDEDMERLTERVQKMVGQVHCGKNLLHPHRLIQKLLDQDAKRREEFARTGYSWEAPLFDSLIEQRRLRIWNALFTAAARLGCSADLTTSRYAEEDRRTSIVVGSQRISFALRMIDANAARAMPRGQTGRMRLAIVSETKSVPDKTWEDADGRRLEDSLTDVLVVIIVAAEASYRRLALQQHAWAIEQRVRVEKELRDRKARAIQEAKELRERQARERIARLLSQATALRRAGDIRQYVELVLARKVELSAPAADVESWAEWALNQADQIDPLKNGATLVSINNRGPLD